MDDSKITELSQAGQLLNTVAAVREKASRAQFSLETLSARLGFHPDIAESQSPVIACEGLIPSLQSDASAAEEMLDIALAHIAVIAVATE